MEEETMVPESSYTAIDRDDFEAQALRAMDEAVQEKETERRIKEYKKELKTVLQTLKRTTLPVETLKKNLILQKRLFARLGPEETKGIVPITLAHISISTKEEEQLLPLQDELEDDEAQVESEKDRNVRLGEMTAFGSKLNEEEIVSGSVDSFNSYLQQQFSQSSRKRRCRSRKEDPDYTLENNETRWSNSDSDRGSTDEELGECPQRQKRKKIATDDGDKKAYMERIKTWKSSLTAQDAQLDSKYEKLNNGLKVPYRIWSKLYKYQKVCVQWLWELHQQDVGGILGDEMGLGKTIQILAYLASLSYSIGLGPTLIICPATLMHQWVKESHAWWPAFRIAVLHDSGSYQGKSRKALISSIFEAKGILVTSYSGVVSFKEPINSLKWNYVILDEGHKIRNPDALATLAVKSIPTCHRLILSGSPLQNNLKELWSLFDFIYPGKLGTLPVFIQQFSVPITQGGYSNASRVAVATAYKCATVLRDTITPYLLRRMKSDVKSHINLPEKSEQILFCRLTDEQRSCYRSYLDSSDIQNIFEGKSKIFAGLINLRKICNHPDLYANKNEVSKYGHWRKSGKMIVVEALLKLWKKQEHRVLLFTQSRQLLSLLEIFIQRRQYSYLKLDGTTSVSSRQSLIDKFNEDPNIFVFILTTKVGGLGVNLVGANRVVIFDPDWNPSTDTQARERAWRIGQKNQVTIYRLITSGTIEEKIYHRQIFKQFLVNRVLKDPKQKRFFKSNDLYELFTLKEGKSDRTETSAIFAGTGSEVRKRDVACFKPNKKDKKPMDVKKTLEKIYEEDDPEKARLREMARKISQKLSNGKSKELEKKRSKSRDKKVEGVRISNLVKTTSKEKKAENEPEAVEQDNYVLSKLFKKSGIQSAVRHDVIVGSGDADYCLIEQEADNVAKDAIKNLKMSRRRILPLDSGVPTWTGSNGGVKTGYSFGKSKLKSSQTDEDLSPSKESSNMSAAELLSKIKKRNSYSENGDACSSDEGSELLADIRNYVAFQANIDGEATTQELVDRFKSRLPSHKSHLFKALLKQLCDFNRDSFSVGKWTLKEEFR
ncbi:DNA excision repair protein ERCC-6 [Lepeophtheirus salmonis]|uniref:DNA excision repair protein ERCC-6 n=1 Tax=Lepeophtheirus salmonis TaxID=72036 RepID=A0A0K2T3V2_LEPSM|nr:DNA excision repair protein ERCC-6-like [Lepeophtheirus salmonis]